VEGSWKRSVGELGEEEGRRRRGTYDAFDWPLPRSLFLEKLLWTDRRSSAEQQVRKEGGGKLQASGPDNY